MTNVHCTKVTMKLNCVVSEFNRLVIAAIESYVSDMDEIFLFSHHGQSIACVNIYGLQEECEETGYRISWALCAVAAVHQWTSV